MAMPSNTIEVIGDREGRKAPQVSVVIPSRGGEPAERRLGELVSALRRQRSREMEIIVVRGVAPQGRAINLGVEQTRGSVLVIMDDDAMPGTDEVIETLVCTLEGDRSIGMAGASVRTPPSAGPFQIRAARQFPRFNVPVVDEVLDSDMACHGCSAFPKDVFLAVGGEREELVRGLDPDLRHRIRQAGFRVVLAPRCAVYHPLPPSFVGLMRTFFRNGQGSAFAQRYHPELVFETDEGLDASGFRPTRPFGFRALRFPLRLLKALVTGKPLRFAAYLSYGAGFVWGYGVYLFRPAARARGTDRGR